MKWLRRAAVIALFCAAAPPLVAADAPPTRLVELRFTPTGRAQIALWIESADGARFQTVGLTQAVSYRGIGNRPGATQMNSGFRWPYGRREGVLPIWAHRRVEAGGEPFSRVIFQDRTSEGWASRSSEDHSRDDYFCLSFDVDRSQRDALDAVSCASVFSSDKGRYLTNVDASNQYSEPWEDSSGTGSMRPLSTTSPYPPRRDVERCASAGCTDHSDVARYVNDARRIMPEIDAITLATPPGEMAQVYRFEVPDEWPSGQYIAWLEINVEGDYNEAFNDDTRPTPSLPTDKWDSWAKTYGYAYRGQPSVVYRVPFAVSAAGGTFTTDTAFGYGDLEGQSGTIHPLDERISADPEDAPGSGADRLLRSGTGERFTVRTIATRVCESEDPPPECSLECDEALECPAGFICGEGGTCVGFCDVSLPPDAVQSMSVAPHMNIKESHHWAILRFDVPESVRGIDHYEVRYSTERIVDNASFERALPANAATIDSMALVVPTDVAAHAQVEVAMGGMLPQTTYYVAMRAVDQCEAQGPMVVSEVTTTDIHFTTVSPCFIATAAYGSPMARDVQVLRNFRERHLRTNAPGRAFIAAYETIGPFAADIIRDNELLRAVARHYLAPVVTLVRWLD